MGLEGDQLNLFAADSVHNGRRISRCDDAAYQYVGIKDDFSHGVLREWL